MGRTRFTLGLGRYLVAFCFWGAGAGGGSTANDLSAGITRKITVQTNNANKNTNPIFLIFLLFPPFYWLHT